MCPRPLVRVGGALAIGAAAPATAVVAAEPGPAAPNAHPAVAPLVVGHHGAS